ncbi:hypothetical protein C0J52_26898 [Blattella germanica]|nr:hypothetical protein C0J52_26898 [Blattella germanica]
MATVEHKVFCVLEFARRRPHVSEDDVRPIEEISPDATSSYEVYVKEAAYVPSLPITLGDLWNRITAAVHSVTVTLAREWDEFGYRIEICPAADGGYIEHLQ